MLVDEPIILKIPVTGENMRNKHHLHKPLLVLAIEKCLGDFVIELI